MVRVADAFPQLLQQSLKITLPNTQNRTNVKQQGAPSVETDFGIDLLASMKKAFEENAKRMAELQKSGLDPAKRVADIQQKLGMLLKRMQRAALMGDKRTAAAIAKEASGLAKELAAAVKDAASASGISGSSTPILVSSGTSVGPPDTAAQSESTQSSQTAGAAEPSTQSVPAGTAPKTSSLDAGSAVDTKGSSPVDESLQKEVSKALAMIRNIIAMAKATLKGKGAPGIAMKEDPKEIQNSQKEVDKAILEVDEASASIQSDTNPTTTTPQTGLTLHFATMA